MTEPARSPHPHGMALLRPTLVAAVACSDVDLLFVINNTASTETYKTNLKNAFPAFTAALAARVAGLPNLHLGVITSDLGTGSVGDPQPAPDVPGCQGVGQDGNLSNGTYLTDIAGPDGTRVTSYTGTLSDAFAPLASVGSQGCGFDQPIEAAVRALGDHPANAGFRRPNAALALVFIGDKDDCSLLHGELATTHTSVLGPLQTFRCIRYGTTCTTGGTTPDEMNAPGPKSGCRSNEQSAYLAPVGDAARLLQALPPDPRDVLVAAIAGDPTPVAVELRPPQAGAQPIPEVAHSCSFVDSGGATEVADPAVRLDDFLGRFARHVFSSVCTNDLTPALDQIALQIGNLLGDPCIPTTVGDPASCQAFDEGPGGAAPVPLPTCGGAAATDCFTLAPDAAACPLGDHLALHVMRAQPAAPGTMTSVRCAP